MKTESKSEIKEKLQWTSQKYKSLYKNTMKGYTPPNSIKLEKNGNVLRNIQPT